MRHATVLIVLAAGAALTLAVFLLMCRQPAEDSAQEVLSVDESASARSLPPRSGSPHTEEDRGSAPRQPGGPSLEPESPLRTTTSTNLNPKSRALVDGLLSRSRDLGLGSSYLSLLGQFGGRDQAIEFLGDTTADDLRDVWADASIPMSMKDVILQLLGTRFSESDRRSLFDLLRNSPLIRVRQAAACSIHQEIVGGCTMSKRNVDPQVIEQVLQVFLAETDSGTRSELVNMMEVYFEANRDAAADRILKSMEQELLFGKDRTARIAVLCGFSRRLPNAADTLMTLIITDSDAHIRRLAAERLRGCVEAESPGELRRKEMADRLNHVICNEGDEQVAKALRNLLAALAGGQKE